MKTCYKFLKSPKVIVTLFSLLVLNPFMLKAEELVTEPLVAPLPRFLFMPEFYIATAILLLLAVSLTVLSYSVNKLTKSYLNVPVKVVAAEKQKVSVLQRFVTLATEPDAREVELDHNYDG